MRLAPLLVLVVSACTADPTDPDDALFGPDARIADATDWAAAVSVPVSPAMDQAFLGSVVRRADAMGADLSADERGQELLARVVDPPPPGGVGYGYFYDEPEFLWNDSTAIIQAMVAPRIPGGDVSTFLYNTMTNRSNLGVEAFIGYRDQDDLTFLVFDWAQEATDPWQVSIPYTQLGDYLDNVPSPDGTFRQELLVANRTALVGNPADWVNEVFLFDRVEHRWDRVYQFAYSTASVTDNTYQTNDFFGSWGPIFETFQDHDGSNKPIGTNSTRLVQDGVGHNLTNGNTLREIDDPDLDPPVFNQSSFGFAVGDTSGEPAVTVLEAEDGNHTLGSATGPGWGARPNDGSGTFVSRSTPLNGAKIAAAFEVGVSSLGTAGTAVITVEVFDETAATQIASIDVLDTDFAVAHGFRPVRVELQSIAGHVYRFNVVSHAVQTVVVDRIGLAAI